jgi:hypothetical protein
MKIVRAVAAVLLSLHLCAAQDGGGVVKGTPDEAYTRELVRLIEGLQKNPWQGWKSDTVVVVRYLGDTSAGTAAHVQPDLVYRVVEADKLFNRTQVVKGKPVRQEFLVKDQPGLDAASVWFKERDKATTEIELDGFTLPGLLSELRVEVFPGGSRTTKEWSLAAHPSVLLRQETNGVGWRVTSAKVSKKIGEREFQCVEIKKTLTAYHKGRMDVETTQYLSPDVPGHLVEEIQLFFRSRNGQKSPTPFMVVHQKVVELQGL